MIFWICWTLIFLPITLLFPVKVIGRKNYTKHKHQNVIVCCNHTSNFDAPLIDIKLRKKFYYLCKKELFKNKFLGFFLRKFGCISVDRQKADLGAVKKILKALNDKKSVGVFPQGTRGQVGEIDVDTVKDGVAMFAIRTNTPVLPMALIKKPKVFRRNMMLVGELIYPDQERSKDKEYINEFTHLVVNKINELFQEGEARLCKKK